MTVSEIIKEFLLEKGYEGLFNEDGECGCLLDDLMPCGELCANCQPGYKLPGDEEYDFLVGLK